MTIWTLYPVRNDCSYPGENCTHDIEFEFQQGSVAPYTYINYEVQPNITYQMEKLLKRDLGIEYNSGRRLMSGLSAPF